MKTNLSSKKFDNFQDLSQSAKNWEHHCAYRLKPEGLVGEHHVITLPNMQLSYSNRAGGFMHNALAPKGAITIAVIQLCEGAACFRNIKLRKGMIVFLDDSQTFNFMSSGPIKVAMMSFKKAKKCQYQALFEKYIEDDKSVLSTTFENILQKFLTDEASLNLQEAEKTLHKCIQTLIKEQPVRTIKLTEGEKIALSIRDQVYHHMDVKINIESLAAQHGVSQQTLQNSFKSLFGFTPNLFLRLLKLNLVHHDLKHGDPANCTVLRIANKWGFTHMGRFSGYYTKLFKENPSETLKKVLPGETAMQADCVSRKEEI